MAWTPSPVSTEEIATSSVGVFPTAYTSQWTQKRFSEGTASIEEFKLPRVYSEEVALTPLQFKPQTVDVAELRELLTELLLELLPLSYLDEVELLRSDVVPYKSLNSFKVEAQIGNVRTVKVSPPLLDDFEESFLDE